MSAGLCWPFSLTETRDSAIIASLITWHLYFAPLPLGSKDFHHEKGPWDRKWYFLWETWSVNLVRRRQMHQGLSLLVSCYSCPSDKDIYDDCWNNVFATRQWIDWRQLKAMCFTCSILTFLLSSLQFWLNEIMLGPSGMQTYNENVLQLQRHNGIYLIICNLNGILQIIFLYGQDLWRGVMRHQVNS